MRRVNWTITLFEKTIKYEWVFLLNLDYNVIERQNNQLNHESLS